MTAQTAPTSPEPLSDTMIAEAFEKSDLQYRRACLKLRQIGSLTAAAGCAVTYSASPAISALGAIMIGFGMGIFAMPDFFKIFDLDLKKDDELKEAAPLRIRSCRAFAAYPGMEPWADYLAKIDAAGRAPLNSECAALEAAWAAL